MLRDFISVAANSGPSHFDFLMNISMYVGFSELVKSRGIAEAAKHAASLGFSSVELLEFVDGDVPHLTFGNIDEAEEALRVLSSHGLSVSCLSVCANVVDIHAEAPTAVKPVIERLKKCADIAAALECPYLHHTLISHLRLPENAPSYDEVLPLVLEAAKEVADYCLSLGITCLYEPQGFYINGSYGFGSFFSLLKKRCKNVGVCGDMGNMLFADEPEYTVFEKHAADIKHVHIKDYYIKDELSDGEACKSPSRGGKYLLRAPIGKGDINIAKCLKLLKNAGYNGAFSIEDSDVAGLSDTVKTVQKLLLDNFI